jgi:hypothetical protein
MSKRSNSGHVITTVGNAVTKDIEKECLGSPEKEIALDELTDEFQIALAKKKLTLEILKQNWRDSLYNAVSVAILMLSAPFNVTYSIRLLRYKTSEYMIGHRSKFQKFF